MIDCLAVHLCDIFSDLTLEIESLLRLPDQNEELSLEWTKTMHRLRGILYLDQYKHVFDDPDLYVRLWRLRVELENEQRFTPAVLARELQGIMFQAQRCLAMKKFAYIPPGNDQYFERSALFGDKVNEVFQNCASEIKDAGNAYAAELYTACVFYLMRVSEYGLRAIAEKLGVTIRDKSEEIPLQYGDWNKVIEGIDNKIKEARKLPNNQQKDELLKRYSEATERLERAKDIWRNDICHARTRMDEPDAKRAITRTKDLMEFLADTLEKSW